MREARVQEVDGPLGVSRGHKTPSPADGSLLEGVAHRGYSQPSAASMSAGVPQESCGAGNAVEKGNLDMIFEANDRRNEETTPMARSMEPPIPIKQPRRPVQPLLEQSSARVDPLTARGVENVIPSPDKFSSPHGEPLGFQYEKAVVGNVQSETESSGMRGARAVIGLMIDHPSSAPEGGVHGQRGQGGGSPSPVLDPRDVAVADGMRFLSSRDRADFDSSHTVGAIPGVAECDIDDYDLRESSNFLRHFFRDASRVKRLLESLEKTDASAGDGLVDEEDADRFVDSLGLVEFKPLARRLAVTLVSLPEGLFADPCLSVVEPRTNRALRDQVGRLTY